MFYDRYEAGESLADKLQKYKGTDSIVLALPRGGVPIGYVIANALNLPLDVTMVKKLGHPVHKEFAIGSVSLNSYKLMPGAQYSSAYIAEEVKRIREALKKRYKMYTGNGHVTSVKGKNVIIVDDGLATGSTIMAAIDVIREQEPKKIIVAVPVAPYSSAEKVMRKVEEFVCPSIPENFQSVGQFYHDFSEVSDEEVIDLLQHARHKRAS